MTRLKDTLNETVVAFPIWMWFLGGFFTAGGIALFVVFMLPSSNISADAFALPGGFLFVGIFFFVGLTTKVTFDNALGNIIIRQYIGLWPYRTKYVPKKEVQYATTRISEGTSGIPGGIDIPSYDVSIRVAGRKKEIKIGTLSKSKCMYLADRINAFIRFE